MADLNKIIDELSTLTVVEAAELSKQLEEKWGVTAAAPAAAAGGTALPRRPSHRHLRHRLHRLHQAHRPSHRHRRHHLHRRLSITLRCRRIQR